MVLILNLGQRLTSRRKRQSSTTLVKQIQVQGFVRSGYMVTYSDKFQHAGVHGFHWSSRASSINTNGSSVPSAYDLDFNDSGVAVSGGPNYRFYAFPLRCLSTVLGM